MCKKSGRFFGPERTIKKPSVSDYGSPEDADLIVVNTCGFINDAKSESIQAIFEALKIKANDKNKKVFVTGCLSERYKSELNQRNTGG